MAVLLIWMDGIVVLRSYVFLSNQQNATWWSLLVKSREPLDMNFENPDSKDFVKMLGRIAPSTYNAQNVCKVVIIPNKNSCGRQRCIYRWSKADANRSVKRNWKKNEVKFGYGKSVVTLQQDNLPDKQNIQPTWKISLTDNTLST
jgi:hypothetical protein